MYILEGKSIVRRRIILRYPRQHFKPTSNNSITGLLIGVICALPVIDLLTSFSEGLFISIGMVIRSAAMVILYGWLTIWTYKKDRFLFIFLQLILIVFLTGFVINYVMKNPYFLMAETKFLLKTAYGVILLCTVIYLLRYRTIALPPLLHAFSWVAFIIGISFWSAVFSGTSLSSYPYDKVGYTGWFFAANEFGVIFLILLALVITAHSLLGSTSSLLALIILLSVIPMLGTKTPVYGSLFLLFFYTAAAAVKVLLTKRHIFPLLLKAIGTVIYCLFLILTPFYENNTNPAKTPEPIEDTKQKESSTLQQQLLSSRDLYLSETRMAFSEVPLIRQTFGMGYGGAYDTAPKMIEMDGYDLLYSWGFIGFIFYAVLLILIGTQILQVQASISYALLLAALGLCTGVSWTAGHVLFAPAVMTWIALLLLCTGLLARQMNHMNQRWK